MSRTAPQPVMVVPLEEKATVPVGVDCPVYTMTVAVKVTVV